MSGNAIGRSCFHILALNCGYSSAHVRQRMSPSLGVVTQLVTWLFLLVLFFDLAHRCGRIYQVRPPGGLATCQVVRETQSCVTILAQVLWVYLGLLILGAFFWRHGASVVARIYAHCIARLTAPEAVARLRPYLRRLLSEGSVGPRLVRRVQLILLMRTTGTDDDPGGLLRQLGCLRWRRAMVMYLVAVLRCCIG